MSKIVVSIKFCGKAVCLERLWQTRQQKHKHIPNKHKKHTHMHARTQKHVERCLLPQCLCGGLCVHITQPSVNISHATGRVAVRTFTRRPASTSWSSALRPPCPVRKHFIVPAGAPSATHRPRVPQGRGLPHVYSKVRGRSYVLKRQRPTPWAPPSVKRAGRWLH